MGRLWQKVGKKLRRGAGGVSCGHEGEGVMEGRGSQRPLLVVVSGGMGGSDPHLSLLPV